MRNPGAGRGLTLSQPPSDPLNRFAHLGGRSSVAEAYECMALDRIEVDTRSHGNVRLLQHAPGEAETVLGEPRHIGIEIERTVDRQKLFETDLGQTLDENAPVLLVAVLDGVHLGAPLEGGFG